MLPNGNKWRCQNAGRAAHARSTYTPITKYLQLKIRSGRYQSELKSFYWVERSDSFGVAKSACKRIRALSSFRALPLPRLMRVSTLLRICQCHSIKLVHHCLLIVLPGHPAYFYSADRGGDDAALEFFDKKPAIE
jgi:hypothetical protein